MLIYPACLKGDCSFFQRVTIQSFYESFCKLLKDNKDEFSALGVTVSELVSHSYPKGAAT